MSDSKITEIQFGTNKVIVDTSIQPLKKAAKHINDILSIHSGRPILLLVAGGSAMHIVEYIEPEYLNDNLTVTVTDERFTDDVEHNNFDTLQTTSFYNELIQTGAFCINTSVFSGDTLKLHSERYAKNIIEWKNEFPKGIIIAIYGIGADGHIGGIIPNVYNETEFKDRFLSTNFVSTLIDNSEKSSFKERITTTLTFMKQIDFPLIYLVGETKVEALRHTLDAEEVLYKVPAKIIQEMKFPTVFTDIEI